MHVRISARTKILLLVIAFVLCLLYWYENRKTSVHGDEEKNISLKLLLAATIEAAKAGGAEVMDVHNQMKLNVESKGKTKEGVNDPVTAADYRSHCAMYHALTGAFPGINVISEEKSKDCHKVAVPDISDIFGTVDYADVGEDFAKINDITVWIDPLDATKEFTENLLRYVTTMVCVAVHGKPIIGVVHKPFESNMISQLYWAWIGHGESTNLKNIRKTTGRSIEPTLIVSRSHAGRINDIAKDAFGDEVKIVSAAGAGYKFLEVAAGNATAYVHVTRIKKWDICAGTAILSALGGKITTLHDQRPIAFGPLDSNVLDAGLLATMRDHTRYFDKFTRYQKIL